MTNKIENQEKRERFYLEKFLEAFRITVESIQRGANPPDFILTQAKKQIAVEVTEFHSNAAGPGGRPRRLIEEEWAKLQQVMKRERKHYPDLDNISGLLFFKKLSVPSRVECPQFVRELAGSQERFSRGLLKSLKKILGGDLGMALLVKITPLLKKYLKRLHLANCKLLHHCGNGELLEYQPCLWVERVRNEEDYFEKVKDPRPKDVSENWLLIVSGHQLSQSVGLPG